MSSPAGGSYPSKKSHVVGRIQRAEDDVEIALVDGDSVGGFGPTDVLTGQPNVDGVVVDGVDLRTLVGPPAAGVAEGGADSMAMQPGASVSGLYLSHPASQYFVLGRLGRDQVADYASRKDWSMPEAERWLAPNLGYRTD